MKIHTKRNYDPVSRFDSGNKGKSETVPGEAQTVRDLLSKFTAGMVMSVGRKVYYDQDDPEDPDFDRIDPSLSPDYDLVDAMEFLTVNLFLYLYILNEINLILCLTI